MSAPLEGIRVLDFSQFLAGPVAAMKLAELGAEVIKIERPDGGDLARAITLGNVFVDGSSISFHAFNRGKKGLALNLKDSDDLAVARRLIDTADVLIQNFRPGVIERIGLDAATVLVANPRLIYASISGFGSTGPWVDRPGQDLLAQSTAGVPWINGTRDDPPTPIGVAIADALTAHILVEGILAKLIERGRTGRGGLVETSLIESMVDLQFEMFSTLLAKPGLDIERGGRWSAHAMLNAPYGIYQTSDGYVAVAMGDVPGLGRLIGCTGLERFTDSQEWFDKRDEVRDILAGHLRTGTSEHWLELMDSGGYWCSAVLRPLEFIEHPGFQALGITGALDLPADQGVVPYILGPLRFDGERPAAAHAAPRLGQHNGEIDDLLGAREEGR